MITLGSPESVVLFALFLVVFLGLLVLRVLGKDRAARRLIDALPTIVAELEGLVRRADALHDQIIAEYGERAALINRDPRMLWVTEQFIMVANSLFPWFSPTEEWVIEKVEQLVSRIKIEG